MIPVSPGSHGEAGGGSPEEWTDQDADRADAEGWNLYEYRGGLEIQRNDENDPPHEDAPRFEDDEHALKWVRSQAQRGSEMHSRALAIHQKYAAQIAEQIERARGELEHAAEQLQEPAGLQGHARSRT